DDAVAIADSALARLAPEDAGSRLAHAREVAELLYVKGLAELARSGAPTAEPYIARAARIFAAEGDRRGEVRAGHAMGRIQYQRGRIAEARDHFRSAAEGYLAVGDLLGRATVQM